MKRIISTLMLCSVCLSPWAKTIETGVWKLEFSDSNGEVNIYKENVLLLTKSSAAFKINETNHSVNTTLDFEGAQINKDFSDSFGRGIRVDLLYKIKSSDMTATHVYFIYPDKDYILTELKIDAPDVIASNYMSPLTTATPSQFLLDTNGSNAVLIVPYDNDAWVRYASKVFRPNSNNTSYEAACFYNIENNKGLVVGSIEHDNWKTGIVSSVNSPNILNSLIVYGGISDNYSGATPTTRDQLPHGKVKGRTIKSPKVMIGYFDDWRSGMETYGDLNAIVAPKLPWNEGTPFGWNSWGNAQTDLSYAIAAGASSFIATDLSPEFSNNNTTYIGLDSYWTNITAQNRRRFINDCNNRGQKPGIYWTPFVDWSGSPEREVEGTNGKYRYGDIMLKINGQPAKFPEGNKGWALDPTHPGTKMRIDHYVDQWISDGYKFIKIDFMTHGSFEGDSWYDQNVTTGMQAYNHGLKYFADKIDGKMYINLSIAPLFPAQYAHGRRYACDTYGSMKETQYALNALTHSWWTDRFYSYNDPDYMVFGQFTGNGTYPSGKNYTLWSSGENRARYTSVVTSGLCLVGDDFLNCTEEARTRAKQILKNEDINRIAKIGKSFKPVKTDVWGTNQTDLYMLWDTDTLYLAAYHFATTPSVKTLTVDYSELNLPEGRSYKVHELWANTESITDSNDKELSLKIPRSDARIFKIYVDGTTSIGSVKNIDNKLKLYPNPCRDKLFIARENLESNYDFDLYTVNGCKLMTLSDSRSNSIDVNFLDSGYYLLVSTESSTRNRLVLPFVKE